MRRVLTTLMILLVVLVAGLSALVLLVNPNDFRAYMVRQVEARSGYQLKLDGPLRWHVWPQLSILSGRMSLTAPGASQPLVSADNMRLDVALIPLISHQLQVKQVMLKGAVIQLTPQTEAVRDASAPVAPRENTLPDEPSDTGWSFDIGKLKVADSVLVFQHEHQEQVTIRNINLQMEQDAHHLASLEFSGRVNRDQRDLTLSLNANVNASDYPHQLTADIQQLNWQLTGADLPTQGITGQGTLQAVWREEQKQLELDNLNLQANDSSLKGQASVTLEEKPKWVLNLQFDKLNLENLLPPLPASATNNDATQTGQSQAPASRPVISSNLDQPDYNALRGFTADILLKANSLRWRGIDFTDVSSQMFNHNGLLVISELSGKMGAGNLSLPGTLDVRKDVASAEFQPRLDNVEIGTILNAFNYPISLTGQLTLAGDFSGTKIDADAFRREWQGQAHLDLKNSRMEGLNFQQLVQQAVERSSDVKAQDNYDSATRLDSFTADLTLDNGQLTLNGMQGASSLLSMTGEGKLDLVKETADTRFNVRVLSGWQGESKLIDFLKETPVPLTVYGKWQALNYSLQVDQILRKHLQDEAKRRLSGWADRNKDSQDGKDVKKLLDKL
ncbi:MAG TPA: outer membrane assembly protein AsmA [Enterobacter asburiae]|uniref:outer membrane assembly protein AsmA n=1 Tax=Enterobacter asburiae TaxID=61645 RepID=UPI000E7FCCA2|nr:outer membrane assembly protein AsmA [Enterobacter asburiae]MBG0651905.1 outer membrane assembly protein AsmA [Enterobacter asburiae]MCK6657041.1 outer membrane assembly protein AsmA [Enterobacter asburiae]WJW89002.1 outer membrane assembly protein AsmA [Enterobacter asburiae]HBW93270.1 outer membrane assembly protein AsmA [Enterobacter asburiae]HCF66997.1 outer membrane assembly protein AsmA [Enterobacter asburiae]